MTHLITLFFLEFLHSFPETPDWFSFLPPHWMQCWLPLMLRGSALGPHLPQLDSLGDLFWSHNFRAHLHTHFLQSMPPALAIQSGIVTSQLRSKSKVCRQLLILPPQNPRHCPQFSSSHHAVTKSCPHNLRQWALLTTSTTTKESILSRMDK